MEHQFDEQSVLLLIKEDTKFNTSKRITRIYTILDQMDGVKGYNPQEDQTALEMITSGEYQYDYLIISLEFDDFDFIIQKIKTHFPNIGILVIYDKYYKEIESKTIELGKKFGIKTYLEKTLILLSNLKKTFQQIKTTKILESNHKSRYCFIQNISSGSQGIVDLFLDSESKNLIAIKKVRTDGMNKVGKNKVLQEVELMKSIKSPFIIEFLDSTFDNDYRYINMEYADLGTLESRINDYKIKGCKFSSDEILDWIIEILLALLTLNDNKMMHRDIKSENILLKKGSHGGIIAKLSDLGISRQLFEGVEAMTLCGTPYYVCPEIASDMKLYDFNMDIWSLGVVLYELITLKKPFGDASDFNNNENCLSTGDLYEIIRTKKYPKLPKDTDPRLKFLLSQMLVKNPKRRYEVLEIFKIDFIYSQTIEIIKQNKLEKTSAFQILFEISKDIVPSYKLLSLIDENNLNLIKDASNISESVIFTPYKKSFLSSSIPNTFLGTSLQDAFFETRNGDHSFVKSEKELDTEMEEFFLKLLEKEILISISHPEMDPKQGLSNLIENPDSTYFMFSYDQIAAVDNLEIFKFVKDDNKNWQNRPNALSLSQYILKKGKYLVKQVMNETLQGFELLNCKEHIEFLVGISHLKNISVFDIKYDSLNNDRIVFMLNVYQIMCIHYILLLYTDKCHRNDTKIIYGFKDMTLNNFEIKNIIFRNNKKPPGYYFRLVYSNDIKTRILPNFDDNRILFILYDLDSDILSKLKFFNFKIFKSKALDIQLDRVVLGFVYKHIRLNDHNLNMPSFIQSYLTDFDSKDTDQFPKQTLSFLYKKIQINSDEKTPLILRLTVTNDQNKEIEPIFGNLSYLLKKLQSKNWKISYY